VLPEFRGQGVGHRLLVGATGSAREMQGVEQLTLCVSVTQPGAIHLYERFGFRVFGREPRAMKLEEQWVGELQMVAFLNALRV
jgi:ribosomal protein S18 acetylase RimI-like enzyme